MNIIGLKLKHLRKLLALTQEQFGQFVDIDRSIISQVEIGKFNLTGENIKKIASKYHIPYDFFFEETFELSILNSHFTETLRIVIFIYGYYITSYVFHLLVMDTLEHLYLYLHGANIGAKYEIQFIIGA